MNPDDVSRDDLMWLAGYLEGEAWFGLIRRVGRRPYPSIQVKATDYDVVERAQRLLGALNITTLQHNDTVRLDAYIIKITGKKAAIWMKALYPLMGERRRQQIKDSLEEYESTKVTPHNTLTYAQAEEVRKIYAEGLLTGPEIAQMFGVTKNVIYNTVSFKNYKKDYGKR